MAHRHKLSVCYVAPGQGLLSTVGPTRNVLSLARALGRQAEVAVAFRNVLDERAPSDLRVLEIQPRARRGTTVVDDAVMRGLGYREFLAYLRDLRRFAHAALPAFDVVLEKSWLLSGYLSTLCRRQGRLGVPVENFVPNPAHNSANNLAKRWRIDVGQRIAGYHLRRAPLIIAETEQLKRSMIRHWHLGEERIAVVGAACSRRRTRAPRDASSTSRPTCWSWSTSGSWTPRTISARCSRRWPSCAILASRCTWWAMASCARGTRRRRAPAAWSPSSTGRSRTSACRSTSPPPTFVSRPTIRARSPLASSATRP
jgi:hypothetical protein